jgi:hypothetical protein
MTNNANSARQLWLIGLALILGIVVYTWLNLFSYQEIDITEHNGIKAYLRINNVTKQVCVMPIGKTLKAFHLLMGQGKSRFDVEQEMGIIFYGFCPLPSKENTDLD